MSAAASNRSLSIEQVTDRAIAAAASRLNAVIQQNCEQLATALLNDAAARAGRTPSAGGMPASSSVLLDREITKLRIRRQANINHEQAVVAARAAGATWEQIGRACEITRQAAYDRWGKLARRSAGQSEPAANPPDPQNPDGLCEEPDGLLAAPSENDAAPRAGRTPPSSGGEDLDTASIRKTLDYLHVRQNVDADPIDAVAACRDAGATWEQIGQTCGIAEQAAHDRWGKRVERSAGQSEPAPRPRETQGSDGLRRGDNWRSGKRISWIN